MRKQNTILGALAVAALLAAAAPAMAQPPGGPHGMRGRGHEGGRDLSEFLGLTDQQREAWRAAHRSQFEALRPTFEKIRDLREQMEAELESASPDAATVGGYVISIDQLDDEIEASRDELDSTLRGILTDEQETKYDAWLAANPGRSRHGFGPPGWGRRGHPPGDGDDEPAGSGSGG
jgi:Spy/CpxP family protein refolding chaperone